MQQVKEDPFEAGKTLSPAEREEVILKYSPLIKYLANRLSQRLPPNISIDDLISAGVIGLMDAIEKFDPSKNIKFKTYAEFRIRGAMLDELRAQDWVPRSVRKKITELEKTYEKLEKELGRPPEDEEVAASMGISLDEFYQLLDETKGVTFIDIDVIRKKLDDNNEDDILDLIADDKEHDPFYLLNLKELKGHLINAIDRLPEKERLVITLYYYEELTMREIGEILGYTESRISQMHLNALIKIRSYLASLEK